MLYREAFIRKESVEDKVDRLLNELKSLQSKNKKIEKENEQLKQEIQQLLFQKKLVIMLNKHSLIIGFIILCAALFAVVQLKNIRNRRLQQGQTMHHAHECCGCH